MNITFYTFSKKPNSTKQPNTSGTTISCTLKDSCSVLAPSITLDVGTTTAPNYNYAYIGDFGRYYTIENWTYFQGLWTAELSVDVLATYKTSIAAASKYVLRSASKFNSKLVDTTYPTEYRSSTTDVNASANDSYFRIYRGSSYSSLTDYRIWNKDYNDGYVILGVTEEEYKGVTYYVMDGTTSSKFFKWLTNAFPTGEGWSNLGDHIKKAFYKPLTYITTCYWIPSKLLGIAMSSHTISVGEMVKTDDTWNISTPLDILNDTCEWRVRFDIPNHPYTSTRGLWLNTAPYTELTLEFLPFGTIALPMARLANATCIVARVMLDIPTGNAELFIYGGTTIDNLSQLIFHTTSRWGVDLPLTQSTVDYLGGLGAAASIAMPLIDSAAMSAVSFDRTDAESTVAGLKKYAKGNTQRRKDLASRIASDTEAMGNIAEAREKHIKVVPSAIGNFISSMTPSASASGTPGSAIAFNGISNPTLHAQFFYPTDDDNEHRGRPLCSVETLGSLSGFTKCNDGDITMGGTQTEKDAVETYLTSGYYYE